MKQPLASFALVTLAAGSVYGEEPQRIRLSVERQEISSKGPTWRTVNPSTIFSPTEKLRFKVSASFPGYLYVMNQGTSGTYEQLFPRADTGSDNRIEAGKDYVVPVGQGWFRVSGPPGQDVVYWVVSPIELGKHYRPLPPPPPKGEIPAGLRPRCDDITFKARGECIDDTAGVRPLHAGDAVPENLKSVAKPTPRELLFMQDKGATVVSSPKPLAGPVVYELRLAHN